MKVSTLMVRSAAISAFTRVFDALWQRVSNHEATVASSFETRFALLRMRFETECLPK